MENEIHVIITIPLAEAGGQFILVRQGEHEIRLTGNQAEWLMEHIKGLLLPSAREMLMLDIRAKANP